MQIKNVRFIIAAITTFSAYAVYVSRVNLSIAIIAMVDDGHQHATGEPMQPNNRTNYELTGVGLQNNPALLDSSAVATNSTSTVGSPLSPTVQSKRSNQTMASQSNRGGVYTGLFPASKQSLMKPPLISQEKFHWDQTEQGHILGAFFYGYILFQIPGARMAELVGARWILMASTAGSALISLVFPLSTQLDSIHLLMVLRFVMGLCQSAFFPAAYVFFCRWLPESERSVLLPIMFIGSNMGSISTYIMSSYLITSSYGWPSVFYVSGLICLAVTLLWCVFGSNGPQDNWLITKEECNYIMDNMDATRQQQVGATTTGFNHRSLSPACHANSGAFRKSFQAPPLPARGSTLNKSKSANDLNPNQPVCFTSYHPEVIMLETGAGNMKQLNNKLESGPGGGGYTSIREANVAGAVQEGRQLSWCKLLSSIPVWTLIFSMYGNEWSQVVLTYELPTYLTKALDIPIEQNGVINSFFQLSYTVASPILSSLGAYMLEKHLFGMRKIHVRKLFQSLATFGQLACYASVPICGANRGLIIMFMFLAIVFKACANAGDIMVSGDLSPEFAGTIFALANSIGNTAGFFVPMLAGVIVDEQYKRDQWTPFWLTSAAIMGCSGLIFLVFGETRRQNFSADDEGDETDDEDVTDCLNGRDARVSPQRDSGGAGLAKRRAAFAAGQ